MTRVRCAFAGLLCIIALSGASAQRCYVSTTQTVNGGNLDLDVYIQNTSTPFVPGTSSFVVQYDTTVITSPVVVPENDGPWSSADADYAPLSSLNHPDAGYADLLILFNGGGDNTGTPVGATPVRVGTLRFTVVNAVAAVHPTWRGLATVTQMTALANPSVDFSYREITDSCAYHSVKMKGFLQGPYSSGAMTTALRDSGFIPHTQPYSASPWNYAGTESAATIPAGVVDWVLLELRSDSSGASRVEQQAAFIRNDGTIIGADSVPMVGFRRVASGSYHVVLRHRNHLAAMISQKLVFGVTGAEYDLTTGPDKYFGGDAKDLGNGSYALWAGDVTGNGTVKYNQAGNDRLPILQRIGGSSINASVAGYYPEDVNMNGIVKYNQAGNDRLIILQVIGGVSINATRSTRVPN